jgi:DNA-binding response OmpR family regulator
VRILIVEADSLAAHVLGVAARRLGHKTFEVADWVEVSDALPFEPTACVYGVERLATNTYEPLVAYAATVPGLVTMIAASEIPDPTAFLAFKAGVGDVVRKPYNPFELIERLERLGQSQATERGVESCTLGDLVVDLSHYSARKNNQELRLTKLELRLLFCLIVNAGRLAPTERLLTFGWEDMEPPEPALLKTHISHLRGKLREAGGTPLEITSRHSLGYSISMREPVEAAAR